MDIHSFFKISSARREDFKFIQLEEEVETHTFLRHVPSWWLTLGPVVDRLIEQWEPLQKYFTDLANKDPKMLQPVLPLKGHVQDFKIREL